MQLELPETTKKEMNTNTKKCEFLGCEKTFEAKRKDKRFCSATCRAKHSIISSSRMGAITDTPKPEVRKTKEPESSLPPRTSMPMPGNLDSNGQFIFNMLNRDIDRFEKAFHEERQKKKKAREEADKLRTELAELKTDLRIRDIETENKKPSTLDGLKESFTSLLDHPNIGPHVGNFVGNLLNGGMAGGMGQFPAAGDEETQHTAVEILNWYALQEKETQQAFKGLVDLIAQATEPAKVNALIEKLLNVLKGGSTFQKAANAGSAAVGFGS